MIAKVVPLGRVKIFTLIGINACKTTEEDLGHKKKTNKTRRKYISISSFKLKFSES